MSQNPFNLALRFLLEVLVLVALALWGWGVAPGVWGGLLAVALPVMAGALWVTFRGRNEPGPEQDAIIPVPGAVRLLLEFSLFGGAVAGLVQVDRLLFAQILGGLMIVHYALAYDRILWLLRH